MRLETVGDILAEMDGALPLATPAAPPIHFAGAPEPGIHFGLPEEEYHAAPGFSASGMKNLAASPMDFWARSWMNPDRGEDDSDSVAKQLGRAYHQRILEGAARFRARHVEALEKHDFDWLLETNDDLIAALAAMGVPVKSGARKAWLVEQLTERAWWLPIWSEIRRLYDEAHAGKVQLPAKTIRRIEVAAAMIERHPQLRHAFTGGFPEVSIFWTCAETGVPMKARLDYLKQRAIVDLKSIGNPFLKAFEPLIYSAVAGHRYYAQAAVYDEAVAAAKALVAQRGPYAVFRYEDADAPDPQWVAGWLAAGDPQFLFVFQQTGIAPVARGMVLPREGATFQIGRNEARIRKERFAECFRTFGTDPWVDDQPIGAFADEEFPSWLGAN